MGKFKEFSIEIDGEQTTFFAGEVVTGNVKLHLSSPLSMLRLIIFMEGKARCTNGATLTEIFLNNHVTLFGCPPERDFHSNSEHPAGVRTYPFRFQLPEELPTSVQESNGEVRYKLTARILFKGLKGLISKDWRVTKPVHIKQVIDGNKEDNKLPVKQVLRKKPGFFSKSNSTQKEDLMITMERSMYCPGEELKIQIRYKDVTARKMAAIKSRLIKYVLFNPKENKRRYASRKVIQESNDSKIYDDRIYQRILTIPIPEGTTPTNILTKSIKLNYTVHVKIDGYPELKIPLRIGTRELLDEQSNTTEQQEIQLAIERSNHEQLGHSESNSSFENITHPSNTTPAYVIPSPTAPPYDHNEWNESAFMYPPEYIPENEFDLPPSYDEAVASQS